MDTNEINQDNIKTLVKLGINVKDLIDIYSNIVEEVPNISKEEYINNLTEMIKFFQTRNKGLTENEEVIFKDDVLEMIKHNKKLIALDLETTIKFICNKLDAYYFMMPNYTNRILKKNPKIFSINKIDLELYAGILSSFAIKIDKEIVNLFEYILKKNSKFLNNDIQKVFQRLMYIKEQTNSKIITDLDILNIESTEFKYHDKTVDEGKLKEKYNIPSYSGEGIEIYKEKILKYIE